MLALEGNFAQRQDRFRGGLLVGAPDNGILIDEASLPDRTPCAEPEHAGFRLACHGLRLGTFGIQHQKIACCLVREDASFRRHIIFHVSVAIEMIRGDVEDNGDSGMKLDDGFQLETGDFQHVPAFVRTLRHQRNDRQANVAAHLGGLAAGAKNFSAKCRRCRLAVRSRDGEDFAVQKA